MEDYEYFLKKVGDFHGGCCVGIALGTRMTLAAMRYLGLDPHRKEKNIIAYAEIDRCMTDAVLVITGCTLGRRSLKHIDYGKFAVTLVNQTAGKAVRATIRRVFSSQGNKEETLREIEFIPEEELVTLQEVEVIIPENDLPGSPRKTTVCDICGERVVDDRDIERDGFTLCRGCANGAYYTEVKE
jgi:formylmethanofuran dehydrogenase subunit E